MGLIKQCQPKKVEDWIDYYLESGKEAHRIKSSMVFRSFAELRNKVKVIDSTHGKTMKDLEELAKEFQEKLKENGIIVDLETAFNYTFIRAVDEAYIGYQREKVATEVITTECKKMNLTVKPTSVEDDIGYGVDLEVFNSKNDLIAGIQIKGTAYKNAVNNKYKEKTIARADKLLNSLNQKYLADKKAPVLFAYITKHLEFDNPEIFKEISKLTHNHSKDAPEL